MSHLVRHETAQQQADRLLAEDQALRSGAAEPAPREPSRLRKALTPWFMGFANPYMDALAMASVLLSAVILVVLAAMDICDSRAPLASGAYSATMEATSRPAAEGVGGGATRAAR